MIGGVAEARDGVRVEGCSDMSFAPFKARIPGMEPLEASVSYQDSGLWGAGCPAACAPAPFRGGNYNRSFGWED